MEYYINVYMVALGAKKTLFKHRRMIDYDDREQARHGIKFIENAYDHNTKFLHTIHYKDGEATIINLQESATDSTSGR